MLDGLNSSGKSSVLQNELRVWREKVSKLQAARERDEAVRKQQEQQTAAYRDENKHYAESIKKRQPSSEKVQQLAESQRSEHIARLEQRKKALAREIEQH